MLKRLFVYFDKYRKYLIWSIICVTMEAVFELVIPLIMADIIDVGVVNHDSSYILGKSILMVACALISLLLGAIYARLAAKAGQGFGAELRKAEYRKVQSFSFSNMDHFSTPSLITRLTSDITIIQNAICNGLRPMVRGPVMMLMALAMSIVLNPKLAIVFLFAIPVLAGCLIMILMKLRPMYGKMQKVLDKVNSIVQENLTAIRTVKSYVKGEEESHKFSEVTEQFRETSQRAFHLAVLNMPLLPTHYVYHNHLHPLVRRKFHSYRNDAGRTIDRFFELCPANFKLFNVDFQRVFNAQPFNDIRQPYF